MKFFLVIIVLLTSITSQAGTPATLPVKIEDVFVPMGFDSNDRSQVVITGFLPNLCHKLLESTVAVSGKKINIRVEALVYDETNPFCAPVVVPFVETVHLGYLERGKYNIFVNGKTPFEIKSKILVAESTSQAVDDHIYANVDYVDRKIGTREVLLKGYNPSECFELDSIEFLSNNINTFSVLPKMKRVSDFCPMKLVPFSFKATVPDTLYSNKLLLHVRVMDGKAVNSIFFNQ